MSCCSSGSCAACKAVALISTIIIGILAIASLFGVYSAHFTDAGLTFGTVEGGVSIIAAVFALKVGVKMSKKCCGCCSKGACAASCAAGCGCGDKNCNCGSGSSMQK